MPEITEIVDVAISVQSAAVSQAAFDTILLNGDGGDTGQNNGSFNGSFANHEVRKYTSYTQVAEDAGIKPGSNVILMAQKVFAQSPAVSEIYIARSDRATGSPQISELSILNVPLVTGQFVEILNNGVSVGTEDFATSNDVTMQAVADAIAALAHVNTAVSSGEVGTEDTITITDVDGENVTDISLKVYTGDSGDIPNAELNETVLKAITTRAVDKLDPASLTAILSAEDGFFGYVHEFTSQTDANTAVFAMAAAKKFCGFAVSSTGYKLGSNYAFTISDTSLNYANVSWLSAMLGRQIGSYNPAYMRLELTTEGSFTAAQEQTLRDNYVNQYSLIAGVGVTFDGKASNGGWIDTYINILWLEAQLQQNIFNLQVANDKLPFDESGIAAVGSIIYSTLQTAENLGVISASPKFTISLPSLSSISAADRSNRILNGITFTAYTGAGINKTQINGTLID